MKSTTTRRPWCVAAALAGVMGTGVAVGATEPTASMRDVPRFLGCFAGPGEALSPGCYGSSVDLDLDGDVDLHDFATFQAIYGLPRVLAGDDECPAVDALADFEALGVQLSDEMISTDFDGARIARTQLEIVFWPDASAAEVNAVLQSINADIVSIIEGTPALTVRIPDPGSLAALDAVIAQLDADPAVEWVRRGDLLDTQDDCSGSPPQGPVDSIAHHLAVRAHAAWNVRRALPQDPTDDDAPLVIVADGFGGGRPNGDFCANVRGIVENGLPNLHGYAVLGVIAGCHSNAPTARGRVKGIYPGTLDVVIYDYVGEGRVTSVIENAILRSARLHPARNLVVNTSLGRPMEDGDARQRAVIWIRKVRGLDGAADDLTPRMLHATAAGNADPPRPPGSRISPWAAARLLPGLTWTDAAGQVLPVENLDNTLVVENTTLLMPQANVYEPSCLAQSSMQSNDISAIGTDVWTFTGATEGADCATGTSLASPQVAGLAAYLWALRPQMSASELRWLLQATAVVPHEDPPGSGTTTCADPLEFLPSPAIDAYAAILAVDRQIPSDSLVRRTLLDVDENDVFDQNDLIGFLNVLYNSSTGDALAPAMPDYSRHDLNGDGFTGGPGRGRFDLDVNHPPTWTSVSAPGISKPFDELELTDIDILCYYAYSDLYSGLTNTRDLLLRDRCGSSVDWLTSPAGGARWSGAGDLSADGTVVVGAAQMSGGSWQAVRWDGTTGTALTHMGGDVEGAGAVSSDGTIVVGESQTYPDPTRAILWVGGDGIDLSLPEHALGGYPTDVSANGSVIVGILEEDQDDCPGEAAECPELSGMQWSGGTGGRLAALCSLADCSAEANAVSAAGSVVVGSASREQPGGGIEAVAAVWNLGVLQALPNLEGFLSARANGVSDDGTVVVGTAFQLVGFSVLFRAVRWIDGSIDELDLLPGTESCWASDASADGSVIVGWCRTPGPNSEDRACRWIPGENPEAMDLTKRFGHLFPQPGRFAGAAAVSPDGRYIVGWGLENLNAGVQRGFRLDTARNNEP